MIVFVDRLNKSGGDRLDRHQGNSCVRFVREGLMVRSTKISLVSEFQNTHRTERELLLRLNSIRLFRVESQLENNNHNKSTTGEATAINKRQLKGVILQRVHLHYNAFIYSARIIKTSTSTGAVAYVLLSVEKQIPKHL